MIKISVYFLLQNFYMETNTNYNYNYYRYL